MKRTLDGVRVHLLGTFRVEVDGTSLDVGKWRRRPAELLKLVVLARDRSMRRDEAIAALWPEKDTASGANNLHRALHDLRKLIGDGWVLLDKGTIHCREELWSDVAEFEAAASSSEPDQMQRAVDAYGGDLCPQDVTLEALEPLRVTLRDRFTEVALKLGRHYRTAGRNGASIDCLRRLLELQPTQEEAHRLIMQAFAADGRHRDALAQYDRCAWALEEHADAEPSPQTTALRDQIAGAQQVPKDRPSWERVCRRIIGTAQLPEPHGRAATETVLDELVEALRGTPACDVLLIAGEAGTGKSLTAARIARAAGEAGAVVFAGACDALTSGMPFAPFSDAWAEHIRATGRPSSDDPFVSFVPSFTPSGERVQEDTLRLFRAVESAFHRVSGNAPTVIIVEDLHWADESSLRLFHFLARSTPARPLLVVGTYRDEEVQRGSALAALLANLRRQKGTRHIRLKPLSLEDTRTFVAELLDREPDERMVERIHGLSGGNPLFVEELVSDAEERGFVEDAAQVPETLAEIIDERLQRLGDAAGELLRVAAVVGHSFRFDWVSRTCNLDETAAITALEASIAARLVEEDDRTYRFRHALVRESIYQGIGRERRVVIHQAIAEIIREADEPVGLERDALLAHHLYTAGRLPEALPHYGAAGQFAMQRVGLHEARGFLLKGLEILDQLGVQTGPERYQFLQSIGALHLMSGELGKARECFATAADLPDRPDGWALPLGQRTEALRWIGVCDITAGDLDQADAVLTDALTHLDADAQESLPMLYMIGQLRWAQGRHKEAYSAAEELIEKAERWDDMKGIASGYEMLSLACHSMGRWEEGAQAIERRKEIVGERVDVAQSFDAHL